MKNNVALATAGAAMADAMFGAGTCAVSDSVTMACEEYVLWRAGGHRPIVGTSRPDD